MSRGVVEMVWVVRCGYISGERTPIVMFVFGRVER